ALHPAGGLVVPHQGVAVDLLVVLGGEVDDGVGAGEVELVRLGLGGVPLHRVLGGDLVELGRRDVPVLGLVRQRPGGERGADELVPPRGVLTQRGGGFGGAGRQE